MPAGLKGEQPAAMDPQAGETKITFVEMKTPSVSGSGARRIPVLAQKESLWGKMRYKRPAMGKRL